MNLLPLVISMLAEGSFSNGTFNALLQLEAGLLQHMNGKFKAVFASAALSTCCQMRCGMINYRLACDGCSAETKALAIVAIELQEPDTLVWQVFNPVKSRPEIWQV